MSRINKVQAEPNAEQAELEAELAEEEKNKLLKIAANRPQKIWNRANMLYHVFLMYFYFSYKSLFLEACPLTEIDPQFMK